MVEYPKFRVLEIEEGDEVTLLGSLTTTEYGSKTWISDGWFGFLLRDSEVSPGTWRAHDQQWVFVLESRQALDLFKKSAAQWDVLDGYWGERAEIVLDTTRQWHKMLFQTSDAVEFRGEKSRTRVRAEAAKAEEGKLIKGGWDHEHCAIQWETIDEDQPEAYFSEPDTWVCEECFNRFVRPRSLRFIPQT
jgi:hypothetical protein